MSIGIIGHVDHGKTTLTAAIARVMATQGDDHTYCFDVEPPTLDDLKSLHLWTDEPTIGGKKSSKQKRKARQKAQRKNR